MVSFPPGHVLTIRVAELGGSSAGMCLAALPGAGAHDHQTIQVPLSRSSPGSGGDCPQTGQPTNKSAAISRGGKCCEVRPEGLDS